MAFTSSQSRRGVREANKHHVVWPVLQRRETRGLGGPSRGNQEWLPGGGGTEAGSCEVSMSRNTAGREAFRAARGRHVHGWSTQPVEEGRQTGRQKPPLCKALTNLLRKTNRVRKSASSCCRGTNSHLPGPAGKSGGGGAVNSTEARRSHSGLIRTTEQFEGLNYRSRQEAHPHICGVIKSTGTSLAAQGIKTKRGPGAIRSHLNGRIVHPRGPRLRDGHAGVRQSPHQQPVWRREQKTHSVLLLPSRHSLTFYLI